MNFEVLMGILISLMREKLKQSLVVSFRGTSDGKILRLEKHNTMFALKIEKL